MLSLYRRALAFRHGSEALLGGSFEWRDGPRGSLIFARASGDDTVVCAINVDAEPFALPPGEVLLGSDSLHDDALDRNSAVWIRPD
jgi:alpha-glucosidase